MEWVIVILLFAVSIAVFKKALISTGDKYRKHRSLFTAAERSFLGVLDQAVSDKYRIFGKVRVADVITPAAGISRKQWRITFNRISAKHFDYVLCSKDKLEVLAVIELDDKSHNSKKTKNRDALLNNACESAGLKLIRFQAKRDYQIHSIRKKIEVQLNPNN